MIRTRFAPSPTGDLHVGGAWTALASWALARAHGGTTLLRLEDIDTPRVVAGSAARIDEDLAWLGLDWDVRTPPQSARLAVYERALAKLASSGLTYLCDCSRAEIARSASAPHPGEEMVYPGTCRDAPADRELRRAPAVRLRVPAGASVAFEDSAFGRIEQHVDVEVGDFVLRRGDGVFAYQLVVAVDDVEMHVTDVVRGSDLLVSTARQLLLMRLLGYGEDALPRYTHVPLVVAADGERLAKRTRGAAIRELRARGFSREEVVGALATGLGLVSGEARPMSPGEVAASLAAPPSWRKDPWRIPPSWAI